jgi:hypothetical protein
MESKQLKRPNRLPDFKTGAYEYFIYPEMIRVCRSQNNLTPERVYMINYKLCIEGDFELNKEVQRKFTEFFEVKLNEILL